MELMMTELENVYGGSVFEEAKECMHLLKARREQREQLEQHWAEMELSELQVLKTGDYHLRDSLNARRKDHRTDRRAHAAPYRPEYREACFSEDWEEAVYAGRMIHRHEEEAFSCGGYPV